MHAGGAAAAGVALAERARHTQRSERHMLHTVCSLQHTHTRAHAATLSGAESPEARPPTPARELVAGGGLNAAELALGD